jgi:antitoxin component YwqK of YwqJK toxin-antitoxin module
LAASTVYFLFCRIIIIMFKYILTLLFVNGYCIVSAQNDTTWYDASWKITGKKNASFYRPPYVLTDSGYLVRDYYISGKLQYIGLSEDPGHENMIGTATWFRENGKISGTKHYSDLIKEGEQKTYTEINELVSVISYSNWKKNGTAYYYYNDGGEKAGEILWKNNKRDGEAVTYYKNGKLKIKAFYVNDLSHGDYEKYYENGGLEQKRTFDNGIPVGLVVWLKENGDTLSVMRYENGLLNGRYRHRWITATLKDGKLEGDYYDRDNVTAFFKDGRMISWNVNYEGVATTIGKAMNDSMAFWQNYHYKTGILESDGYSKYDKPFGVWTFYTEKGDKKKTYNITTGADPDYRYINNEQLWFDFPSIFNGLGIYDLNDKDFKKPFTAIQTLYNKNGQAVATGAISNEDPVGTWTYTKPRLKQLRVDFNAKTFNKKEVLEFIEIIEMKTGDYFPDSWHFIEPWKLYINPSGEGNPIEAIGVLIEQLYKKDRLFINDLLGLIKQKLGKSYSEKINKELRSSIDFSPPRIVEDVEIGERAPDLPVLLRR